MGLSSVLTGSDAILDSVSSDVIGQFGVPFLSSVLALLDCSFARFYKMVVGLLAREGVTVLGKGEKLSLLLSWGEIDLWVRFSCHNRVGHRQGLNC